MSKIAIKAENISKQYRLGEIGTGTISHDLNRWWHKIRGKEDPFLKIGESNDRSQKGESDYVWSLKDINFEINQGDAVGIIGRNGAGKSTLLKLLSKVTKPTTGQFKVNGRIASLLEVGTGFHPEMTGRENIYLNGAILGMPRIEISRKFDEIVDFSGIERYIDTPVKRYSSGMYVRLAFAVAAHLESEILIVDEVLAVGDAEFQKKCLGKMGDASNQDGRTVLFVSHNMAAMQTLCSKAILLENGHLALSGTPTEVVSEYLNSGSKLWIDRDLSCITTRKGGNSNLRFTSYDVVDLYGKSLDTPTCGSQVKFILNFQVIFGYVDNLRVGISFKDRNTGDTVTQLNSYYGSSDVLSFNQGNHSYIFTVNHLPLSPDQYILSFIATSGLEVLDWLEEGGELIVSEGLFYDSGKMPLDANAQIFFTEYSCGPSSSVNKCVS